MVVVVHVFVGKARFGYGRPSFCFSEYAEAMRIGLNRAALAVVSVSVSLALLAGCTWFLPSTKPSIGGTDQDRLAGIFVVPSADSAKCFPDITEPSPQNKVMASQTINDDGMPDYAFPGLSGAFVLATQDDVEYSIYSDRMDELNMDTISTDTSQEVTVSGTVQVDWSLLDGCLLLYLVYQTPDGSVYAINNDSEESIMWLNTMGGPNGVDSCGQSFSETSTVELMGVKSLSTSTVSLTAKVKAPPLSYAVMDMDANNQVINKTSFLAGQMPTDYRPVGGAAYLLVEITAADQDGTLFSQHLVVDHNGDSFLTYDCGDDGICAPDPTQVDWS